MRAQFGFAVVSFLFLLSQTSAAMANACEIQISKSDLVLVQNQNHMINGGQNIEEFGELQLSVTGPVKQISFRTAAPGESLTGDTMTTVSVTTESVLLRVSKLQSLILEHLNPMGLQMQLTTLGFRPTDAEGRNCLIHLAAETATVKKEGRSVLSTVIPLQPMQEIYALTQVMAQKENAGSFPQSREYARKMFEILLKEPTPKVAQLLKISGFSKAQAIDLALKGLYRDHNGFAMIWNCSCGDFGAMAIVDGMFATENFGNTDLKTASDIRWTFEGINKGDTIMFTRWADGKETVRFEKVE